MLFAAVLSVFAMQRALITRDFTVLFVAKNGSSRTPPLFNVATMWSALEGSILLWALALSAYVGFTTWRFRARAEDPLVASNGHRRDPIPKSPSVMRPVRPHPPASPLPQID